MPFHDIRTRCAAAIAAALETAFGHRAEQVAIEVPPRRSLGDLAWPGALPLARVLRRAPREIAETVVASAAWPEGVARVEVAGPGFVNIFLDRPGLLRELLARTPVEISGGESKTIVEHTNINLNKAAHIGHLRNAVLGNILVRSLRPLGALPSGTTFWYHVSQTCEIRPTTRAKAQQ